MESASQDAPVARGWPWAKIAAALLALIGFVALTQALGPQAREWIAGFASWVDSLGIWGPAAFVLGYVTAVVAFLPASLFTLAAGAVFGVVAGTVYAFAAAFVGSALAFLVSRYFARGFVERRIEGDPRFASIDRAVGEQGRRIVFLLRLSPVFPFNLLNYALGLTQVRFIDYLIASLGMLPGTLLYVYLGTAIRDFAALAAGEVPEGGVAGKALFVVGLIATAVVTILVTRIARRALDQATDDAIELQEQP